MPVIAVWHDPDMGKPPTTEWGLRARAAGLDQLTLATLARVHSDAVSRALKRDPSGGVYASLILAWEAMTEDQRAAWVEAVTALRP